MLDPSLRFLQETARAAGAGRLNQQLGEQQLLGASSFPLASSLCSEWGSQTRLLGLFLPGSASGSDTPVPQNTGLPSVNTNRSNCTNRAIHANSSVKLCIDGVAFELEPSLSEDFLRSLIRAVHYA